MLEGGDISGSSGAVVSGIGAQLTWDQRNDIYFPSHGNYFDLKADTYLAILGSTETFSMLKMDYRRFYPVNSDQVLGLQCYLVLSAGTIPFQMMPKLGSNGIMRGYSGQYIDREYLAVQGEYRFHLTNRFGAVAFLSAGKIFPYATTFTFINIKTAAGVGLRLAINRKHKINLRLDIAYGDGLNCYLSVSEAF